MSKDFEILTIADDEPASCVNTFDAKTGTFVPLPDGMPDYRYSEPESVTFANGESRKVAVVDDDVLSALSTQPDPIAYEIRKYPQPTLPGAPAVEYDIVMPGGGVETVKAGELEGVPDTYLKAKRHLEKLKMLKVLMKRQRHRVKLEEAKSNRVAKSRKKRDQQKASRKKNRGK